MLDHFTGSEKKNYAICNFSFICTFVHVTQCFNNKSIIIIRQQEQVLQNLSPAYFLGESDKTYDIR